MRRPRVSLAVFVLASALSSSMALAQPVGSLALPPAQQNATYVGVIVCKSCHGPSSDVDQFTIWSVSKHSRTYVQLGTGYIEMIDPEAKGLVPEGFGGSIVKEAKKLGVNTNCLECHTTADDAPATAKAETFHPEDGVQCEACHGPGSAHVEWRKLTAGSPVTDPPAEATMRVGEVDDCVAACHRYKPTHSPFMSMDFDPEKAWAKIAHGLPER